MISKVDAPFPRFDLAGQTALVTGAARGIGRSIALALANAGADVVLGLRQAGTADDLVAHIQGMGRRALPVEMDVRRLEQIGPAVDQAVDAFGRLDILVNNAGLGPSAPAGDMATPPRFSPMVSISSMNPMAPPFFRAAFRSDLKKARIFTAVMP